MLSFVSCPSPPPEKKQSVLRVLRDFVNRQLKRFSTLLHLLFSFSQHVHSPHVHVLAQFLLGFLQFAEPSGDLFHVVSGKIVCSVGLPKKLLLIGNPIVLFQHLLNLAKNAKKINAWNKFHIRYLCPPFPPPKGTEVSS